MEPATLEMRLEEWRALRPFSDGRHRGHTNRPRRCRDEPQQHQGLCALQPSIRLAKVPKLNEDDLLWVSLRASGPWLHDRSAAQERARCTTAGGTRRPLLNVAQPQHPETGRSFRAARFRVLPISALGNLHPDCEGGCARWLPTYPPTRCTLVYSVVHVNRSR